MPLPRKRHEGRTGAPVLNILSAHVRLSDVDEHVEPYTVTRKRDGSQFTYDPDFNCTVTIVDDHQGGDDNGTTFFETFKYKQDTKTGQWFNNENSKLGAISDVVKPGYFEDDSIPALTKEDLEGFEMLCRVKPKKDPKTGAITGSTIDWETMRRLPERKASEGEEEDFSDIPF